MAIIDLLYFAIIASNNNNNNLLLITIIFRAIRQLASLQLASYS